tara:strand:- start:10911 stop:12206 length:1296 start_codon:yes stop_codon:yes gene_type:complete
MGRLIVGDGSAGITQSKLGLTVFGGLSTQGGLSATCAAGEEIYLEGSVGIGTTAPAAKLEIEDGGTAHNCIVKVTSDDQSPWGLIIGNDTYSTTETKGLGFYQNNDGTSFIYSDYDSSNGNLILQGTGGKVGIGTASPSTDLHISKASNPTFRLTDTTNDNYVYLQQQDSNAYLFTGSAIPLTLGTNHTDHLTIASGGNVGIGTTSPAKLLDISGATASVRFTETGTGARTWEVGSGVASNGAFTIYDVTAGGSRFTVNTTGAIGWGDNAGSGTLSWDSGMTNVYATTDKRLHLGAGNSDDHLIIETNGNIGIGTQHASRSLDIGPKTDGMVIPIGNTSQRPATYLSAGTIRFNSELAAFEGYTGSAWGALGGGNAFDGASIIRYNDQTLGENVTIGIAGSLSANGFTAGPITINDGYTVTIEHGSNWTII